MITSEFDKWLQQKLRAAKYEPYAEVVTLTPEIAAGLLVRNPENRNVSPAQVKGIATDILAGRWRLNGETIIVSEEGYLNDGQHRCHGVVLADEPISTMMIFGVERDSRTTVDEGNARTVSNYLAMDGGFSNTASLAAVAHKIIDIGRNGRVSGGALAPTKQEVLAECRENVALVQSVEFVGNSKRVRKVCTPTTLSVAHYLIAQKNHDKADEFMLSMLSGENLAASDPRFVCREKLMTRDLRLTVNEQLKSIIHAYNNWRSGRSVRTLVHAMKRGEKLPEVAK